jgi:hypothetical protein
MGPISRFVIEGQFQVSKPLSEGKMPVWGLAMKKSWTRWWCHSIGASLCLELKFFMEILL